MHLAPGSQLGSFELLSLLGEGGMGSVYLARDLELGREVAVKVLRSEVSTDPHRLDRFRREARAASSLNHPNIVTIYEVGERDGTHYLAMELVRGTTFRDLIAEGPLEPAEVLRLGIQVAEGLAKAHDADIVHRDLKPENLMLTEDGHVKILDFGLAKLVGLAEESGVMDASDVPTLGRRITESGMVVGTVHYMSPEQVSGQSVDVRSDQFSLGSVLYEMSTGARPFEKASMLLTLAAIMDGEPSREAWSSSMPKGLDGVVERLLSKQAADRFDSTRDVVVALKSVAGDSAASSAPRKIVTAPSLPDFLSKQDSASSSGSGALFVGREAELEKLAALLESARSGDGQVGFVTGEPGRGKTTLLQEFVRRSQEQQTDLIAVVGHCSSQQGARDPYLPVRELVHLMTGDVQARRDAGAMTQDQALRLWHLLPHAVSTLIEVGPDLAKAIVSLQGVLARATQYGCRREDQKRLEALLKQKESSGSEAATQQSVLLEQCARFFQALSRRHPLLLVFEDLHWADAGTIDLLAHLCQHLDGHRILITGSYRAEDLLGESENENHPLEAVRLELQRKFGDLEIQVGVTQEEAFVDALVDARPNKLGKDFRAALYRHTRGHPLFTVELLRDLRDRGVLVLDAEQHYVVAGVLDWESLPVRVEAVVGERIARLSEELRKVLTVGSIEGEDFNAEVVARILNLEERQVVRLLSDAAKRHQLVQTVDVRRAGGQRLSLYRFRHVLFQKYLYQSLDAAERNYMHEDVGKALESLLGDGADDAAVELASHFEQAGLNARAVHYLTLAGHKARMAYANQEAVGFFERAIAASKAASPAMSPAKLLSIHEGRGLVLLSQARFDESLEDFHRMRELARSADHPRKEAEALCHLSYVHFLKMSDRNIPLMEKFSRQALELARKTGDKRSLARSLANLGTVHQTRGHLKEADQALQESLEISAKAGFKDALPQGHFLLGQQAYWQGHFKRAVRISDDGIAVSADVHDGFNELFNLAVSCLSLWGTGSYNQAFEVLDAAMAKAKLLENRFIQGRLLNSRGWFYREFGDVYAAAEYHQEALDLARSANVFNVEISALVDLGQDQLRLGQPDRALKYFQPTLTRVEDEAIGSHRWRWIVRLLASLAEAHLDAGDVDQALRFAAQAIYKARETSSNKYLIKGLALSGKIAARAGDRGAAGRELGKAFALAEELASPTVIFPLAYDYGRWCELNGAERRAFELFGRAKTAAERMSSNMQNEKLRSIFLKTRLVRALSEK